jgi:hypothetical protein
LRNAISKSLCIIFSNVTFIMLEKWDVSGDKTYWTQCLIHLTHYLDWTSWDSEHPTPYFFYHILSWFVLFNLLKNEMGCVDRLNYIFKFYFLWIIVGINWILVDNFFFKNNLTGQFTCLKIHVSSLICFQLCFFFYLK